MIRKTAAIYIHAPRKLTGFRSSRQTIISIHASMSKPCFSGSHSFSISPYASSAVSVEISRAASSSGIRRSAPSTSLCISGARSILSQSSLRSMLPSSVRGCFSILTSASFGFMISRGAPGVKPAFPVISSDEYFFVFLLDNSTLMC